ncbi:MAG: hypothetical protein QE263_02145 [Vampirovibrionales bacterium]|nr:hypothetical protein [Vampirovibrionales bacterium]
MRISHMATAFSPNFGQRPKTASNIVNSTDQLSIRFGSIPLSTYINQVHVSIVEGDISQQKVDACVVPQLLTGLRGGGVSDALYSSGARNGVKAYQNKIETGHTMQLGEALCCESGGGNSKYLIHIATGKDYSGSVEDAALAKLKAPTIYKNPNQTVEKYADIAFIAVKEGVKNALVQAERKGLSSVAIPHMAIFNSLLEVQAAEATLGGIEEYSKTSKNPVTVKIIAYQDKDNATKNAYRDVIQTKSYENPFCPVGLTVGNSFATMEHRVRGDKFLPPIAKAFKKYYATNEGSTDRKLKELTYQTLSLEKKIG